MGNPCNQGSQNGSDQSIAIEESGADRDRQVAIQAVTRAWDYLHAKHLKNDLLQGPDPVGRINGRLWRFMRNYAAFLPDKEHIFLQTQGYWILTNWILFEATRNEMYRSAALACSNSVIALQREDGAWDYPSISYERNGLVATVEGSWAGFGLLATYRHERLDACLGAVERWNIFVNRNIGYESFTHPELGECEAVNYYYPKPRGMVPNNSIIVFSLGERQNSLTGRNDYSAHWKGLLNFIRVSQMDSGEWYYHYPDRQHYLCYQYNAYQFLDLASAYRHSRHEDLMVMLRKSADFLREGQLENGACKNRCNHSTPEFVYHTAVLGNAFLDAYQLGLGGEFLECSRNAIRHVVSQQKKDGSWIHSEGDYGGLLSDKRSYPRYLAMTMYHVARAAWPDLTRNR